jgi:hypothetical protein
MKASGVPDFFVSVYMLFQRNKVLRSSQTGVRHMKKIFALAAALALTAPLAANAATFLTPHDQLVQQIQATYHTSFQNTGK